MSRIGTSNNPAPTEADSRIPFPHSDTPLVCRTNPAWFAHEYGDNTPGDVARMERAKTACRACPLAADCLKGALANPSLTPTGIWAATTARQRTTLRHRLQVRLGLDWVGIVAQADGERALRRSARTPAVTQAAPPAHPLWSSHYEPWREPITPERLGRGGVGWGRGRVRPPVISRPFQVLHAERFTAALTAHITDRRSGPCRSLARPINSSTAQTSSGTAR
jgi:hypothetical protein